MVILGVTRTTASTGASLHGDPLRRDRRRSFALAFGALLALLTAMGTARPFDLAFAQVPPSSTTTAPPPASTTTIPVVTTTTPVVTTTSTTTAPIESSTTTSTLLLVGPPGTEPPGDSSTTIPEGEDEIPLPDEVPPEELELINRYREIESKAADLTTQLSILNGGIASSQRDVDGAQKKFEQAQKRFNQTEMRLAKTEDELEVARQRLRERAVAVYIGGNLSLGADTALLQAANVDDLGKSRAYGNAVVEDEQSIIREASELHRKVDELHDQAERDRDEAAAARDEFTAHKDDLEKKRDLIVLAEADLAKNAQAKIALLSEAAQHQIAVEQGFARVQAVRDSITNTLAQRQVGQTPPADSLGIFLSPIPHPKINQPFGVKIDPLFNITRGHPGIDINGKTGDPIRAPADGVVVAAGWIDGYGNCTIIDHGNALGTLYGHQSLLAVKEGDKVRRGQVIGFVGSTGYSTGPHLHWEVRVLGNVVDPAP
jgi:murein DD-endopeptidase MepM/ murein hydrolase activator NlpD